MALLFRKADDFIFNAGAIARANALNLPTVHGRPVDVFLNDALGFFVRPCHKAGGAILPRLQRVIGKGNHWVIAELFLQLREVNAGAQHPRGGARFEAPQAQAQLPQGFPQKGSREQPIGSAVVADLADVNAPAQKRARSEDDGAGGINRSHARDDLPRLLSTGNQLHDFRLFERKPRLQFQFMFHDFAIFSAVNLGAQRMHRRSFAQIEHPALQESRVGSMSHLPAQRINLAHEMPLGGAADGGVAGAVAHRVQIDGKDHRPAAQPCTCQRCFNPGMARANNRYVIILRMILHSFNPFFEAG